VSKNETQGACVDCEGGQATLKSALILAGAAGKGPFAAGALTAIAAHPEFEVTCVVGTSSGALNAAIYAAGLRAGDPVRAARLLFDLWEHEATWWHIFTQSQRVQIVRSALAEFEGKPRRRLVQLRMVSTSLRGELTKERKYAKPTYTTFETVSVYETEQLENSACLDEIALVAVASAAIPGVFNPVRIGRERFVDGGLVDNAPIGSALAFDKTVDHVVVVTPDPMVSFTRPRFPRFPFMTLVEIIVRERLTRDLDTARTFNKDLRTLGSLVDLRAVRKALDWRMLQFIEIRPDRATPGGAVTGFFSKAQRIENLAAGERAANAALDSFSRRPPLRASPATPPCTSRPSRGLPMPTLPPPKSLHLRKSSELLLIAPIKQGLVPIPPTTSYTTRLGELLVALFELRSAAIERSGNQLVGPLERVTTLHFIQWAILDGGTRLLLAVTFDGPWESYIRGIVDDAGPFLDLIFGHCEGYEGHSSDKGYEAFASWVRAHQIQCQFFHSAFPDISSDDVRYLQAVRKLREDPKKTAELLESQTARVSVKAPPPQATGPEARMNNLQSFEIALNAFYKLREQYPNGPTSDKLFFERVAIRQLDLLIADLPAAPPGILPATWAWYKTLPKSSQPAKPLSVDLTGQEDQIQGNILTGYDGMLRGRLVLLEFRSAAEGAAFLRAFKVTTEADNRRKPNQVKNIALTYAGFETLELDPSLLGSFPEEFREGMDSRAPMLGDAGSAHPASWALPIEWKSGGRQRVALSTVHAIVVFQDTSESDVWVESEVKALDAGGNVRVLGVQPLHRWKKIIIDGRKTEFAEPFGFADGFSQPVPLAKGFQGASQDQVALGEILLGHPNQKGEVSTYPEPSATVFKNGSFLAVRKFRQEVAAFDTYFAELEGDVAARYPEFVARVGYTLRDELKAKALGRYTDGKPLAAPNGSPYGSFNYSLDAGGEQCPLSAHIRRANPRTTEFVVPRIVRRGFAFNENEADSPNDAETEQGLVFMAYCASLAQQYEIVQKWVNGANSTGTLGSQVDPLIGVPKLDSPTFEFPYGKDGVVRVALPGRPLVTVDWGLYLFAPSTLGLLEIARRAGKKTKAIATQGAATGGCPVASAAKASAASVPAPPSMIDAGNAIIARLDALTGPEALEAWRQVIEDVAIPANFLNASAVWAAVRARPGFKETPYGLLVGREEDVVNVLKKASNYSVSEYGRRMSNSFGLLYLGQDPGHDYFKASGMPNEFIGAIDRPTAYEKTFEVSRAVLGEAIDMDDGTLGMDLELYVDAVLEALVTSLFGFGNWETVSVDDYWWIGNYIFGPQPDAALRDRAVTRGHAIHKAGRDFVAQRCALYAGGTPPKPVSDTLVDQLVANAYGSEDEIARAWIGAINGFLAPTSRAARSVLDQWIESGELWRVQQEFGALNGATPVLLETHGKGFLPQAVIGALMQGPVPPLLHRTLVGQEAFELGSADGTATPVKIPAGKRIVLSLASAAQERIEKCPAAGEGRTDPSLLFGGNYAKKADGEPVHACSGKELALGVLMGMAAALMSRRNIRRTARLMVTFDGP
jgi:predicted acylesterase/phospholipase RssA/deferrochelatase/peroxidase EfeB